MLILLVLSQLFSSSLSYAADKKLICADLHRKAVSACAAHEHALNADALTIVSTATRQRVIRNEETKLQNLKTSCLRIQRQCALTCDEEMETASIEGEDLSLPMERLNDCRQGEVAKQLRVLNKKIGELRRVMGMQPNPSLKSAANVP